MSSAAIIMNIHQPFYSYHPLSCRRYLASLSGTAKIEFMLSRKCSEATVTSYNQGYLLFLKGWNFCTARAFTYNSLENFLYYVHCVKISNEVCHHYSTPQ